jgi:hypothetical protein
MIQCTAFWDDHSRVVLIVRALQWLSTACCHGNWSKCVVAITQAMTVVLQQRTVVWECLTLDPNHPNSVVDPLARSLFFLARWDGSL